jgi:hypothetical protein
VRRGNDSGADSGRVQVMRLRMLLLVLQARVMVLVVVIDARAVMDAVRRGAPRRARDEQRKAVVVLLVVLAPSPALLPVATARRSMQDCIALVVVDGGRVVQSDWDWTRRAWGRGAEKKETRACGARDCVPPARARSGFSLARAAPSTHLTSPSLRSTSSYSSDLDDPNIERRSIH